MRPFQEFRLWARGGPIGQRASAGVAMLIVVGLVAWLLVPARHHSSTNVSASNGNTGQSTASTASGGPAPGGVPGGGTSATPGAGGTTGGTIASGTGSVRGPAGSGGTTGSGGSTGASATGQGCVSPPGSAKGITDKEVKVAIVLTEIVGPAANQLFDIETPAQAQADFDAVIAGINKEGGVACRKLVARYYNANPVDESQMMQVCRDIADAGLFAVVDTGSLATRPAVLACFGQLKIPYFGAFYITDKARQQFYPYLYSFYYREQVYKDTAFGLRALGFFDPAKGFKKLGFLYRDCEPEAISAFRGWIRQAGVPDSQLVTYNVGCPAVFASEADLNQAVLTFKAQGVTHVTTANFTGDIQRFSADAEQQGYRPKYGFPDEALQEVATGSRQPDPNNIANALAITLSRDGEQQTPGMSPTGGTQKCNAYRQAARLPPVYQSQANAGQACDQLWMLQAAVNRAPELSVGGLQAGLQRTTSIDFSYPQGANDFTGNRVTTGGEFWRVVQFMPGCKCWQVVQRDFKRGF